MEKVLIEIIGSQNIDNQFDKTEFKTVGTFEELEEKYVIKYKEEQDAGENADQRCAASGNHDQFRFNVDHEHRRAVRVEGEHSPDGQKAPGQRAAK